MLNALTVSSLRLGFCTDLAAPQSGDSIGRGLLADLASPLPTAQLTNDSLLIEAGFARNFQAGLVYTCGLTAIGKPVPGPDEPEGEEDGPVPTHGRVSTVPAEQLSATAGWEDGKYVLRASGVVREVSAFGTNLQLTRRITAVLGEASFRIDDEVENLSSSRASPLMFCYHCNP